MFQAEYESKMRSLLIKIIFYQFQVASNFVFLMQVLIVSKVLNVRLVGWFIFLYHVIFFRAVAIFGLTGLNFLKKVG